MSPPRKSRKPASTNTLKPKKSIGKEKVKFNHVGIEDALKDSTKNCHPCKKQNIVELTCERCNLSFCHRHLVKRYKLAPDDITQKWPCPRCTHICDCFNCSNYHKKRAVEDTEELARLRKQLVDLQIEKDEILKSAAEEKEALMRETQDALALEKQNNCLREELQRVQKEVESKAETCMALQQHSDSLQQNNSKQEITCMVLQKCIDRLLHQNSQLEADLKSATDSAKDSNHEAFKQRETQMDHQETCSSHMDDQISVQNELDAVNKKHEEMCSSLREEKSVLQNQLAAAKQRLKMAENDAVEGKELRKKMHNTIMELKGVQDIERSAPRSSSCRGRSGGRGRGRGWIPPEIGSSHRAIQNLEMSAPRSFLWRGRSGGRGRGRTQPEIGSPHREAIKGKVKSTIIVPSEDRFEILMDTDLLKDVTRYSRPELEVACEDFSNIIGSSSDSIVYKGNMKGGPEIAVISLNNQEEQWTSYLELYFEKEVADLARLTHKNIGKLMGYCIKGAPFTRMLVFEYPSNGTLSEHLHYEEGGQLLTWRQRMMIIVGIAKALKYLHTEIEPPFTIYGLNSSAVYLTDDFSPKIVNFESWKTILTRSENSSTISNEGGMCVQPSSLQARHLDIHGNVYSFGVLLLEIVTGRPPICKDKGILVDWAKDYLEDPEKMGAVVDPALKHFRVEDLEAIREVVRSCIHGPRDKVSMQDLCATLESKLDTTRSSELKASSLARAELALSS